MIIPDFLKRDNIKLEESEFSKAIRKYEEHFGVELNTESYMFGPAEWIGIIDQCLKTNTPIDEKMEEDNDY